MAAQVKEVVMDADLVEFEDSAPNVSEDLRDRISWAAKASLSSGLD